MSRKPVVPPPFQEPEEGPSTLDRILERREFVWGVFAAIVLLGIVLIVVLAMRQGTRSADDRAWALYHEAIGSIRAGADPMYSFLPEGLLLQAADPELQVRVFEGLVEETKGTPVEPYAEYQLGSAYLLARKIERAIETFQRIKSDFPHHYLVDSNRFYFQKSLVDKGLDDCRAEKEFLDANPDFLKGIKPASATSEAGSEGRTGEEESPDSPESPASDTPADDEGDATPPPSDGGGN